MLGRFVRYISYISEAKPGNLLILKAEKENFTLTLFFDLNGYQFAPQNSVLPYRVTEDMPKGALMHICVWR